MRTPSSAPQLGRVGMLQRVAHAYVAPRSAARHPDGGNAKVFPQLSLGSAVSERWRCSGNGDPGVGAAPPNSEWMAFPHASEIESACCRRGKGGRAAWQVLKNRRRDESKARRMVHHVSESIKYAI